MFNDWCELLACSEFPLTEVPALECERLDRGVRLLAPEREESGADGVA